MGDYKDLKQDLIRREKTQDYSGFSIARQTQPMDLNTPLHKWSLEHQDNSFVQNYLGEIHYQNLHTNEAVKWFTKSVEQGNKWSCFDLGWLILKDKVINMNRKDGLELYYKSITPEFIKAIDELVLYIWCHDIEEQRRLYSLTLKRSLTLENSVSAQFKAICDRTSVLSEEEFNKMNRVLEDTYTYPQSVGEWYKMNTEYIKKMSFVHIYETLVNMPEELIKLTVDYLNGDP